MPELIIRRGAQTFTRPVAPGTPLSQALQQAGCAVAQPCGGRGSCGKCAVVLTGSVSEPNDAERRAGARLACQATLLGDAEVILPQEQSMAQIETGADAIPAQLAPWGEGWGAAADVGTTTLALRLYDLRTGRCAGTGAMLNPQVSVAADVIGRMDAAMKGRSALLQEQILCALETLLVHACAQAGVSAGEVTHLVITGNTTMLYLLTGRDPASLSRAPFRADCLFGEIRPLLSRPAYLPPCLHAFVGADISCAVHASGMCARPDTALLCDIGTNGEIALWKDGVLYVTSTAAGPAFEGAGIRFGCGSVRGAIDRVDIVAGKPWAHTIGGETAVGLCGSGLIDAVAALLDLEIIDETGAMDEEEYLLRDGVFLTQADVRAVQLAKAAIAAGIVCLLKAASCSAEEVSALYLAGGFGSHLSIPHAVRIGLLPEALSDRVQVIGNASLTGAALALMDRQVHQALDGLQAVSRHVDLGGDPFFNAQYVEAMMFPGEDW